MNPSDGNLRINIGQDGTGGYANRWTNGLLVDDMAIWTRKLNSGDFASIYNAGTAMVPASLATVLPNELAPDDPPPPNQIFNWNSNVHPAGNFGSVGTPGNETWLDGALAPLAFAPNDPDTLGGALHTVFIDNATVTVTDFRQVSTLNLAAPGTTTTLIVANGAGLDGTSVGGFNVGMGAGSNATMTINGNATSSHARRLQYQRRRRLALLAWSSRTTPASWKWAFGCPATTKWAHSTAPGPFVSSSGRPPAARANTAFRIMRSSAGDETFVLAWAAAPPPR